jgi:hypothetical protein
MAEFNLEFKDMATVEVAESVSESAHVLVEDGGVIKRLSKEEVGSGTVKSVNGTSPDENGNVELKMATSWNDLEDKPFGKEGTYTNVFTDKTITFTSGQADLGVSWENGKVYRVTIDGISQKGVAYYQGNPVYDYIFDFDGGWAVEMSSFIAEDITDGEHVVTINIIVEETITKIDEEFLPELVGKVANDNGGEIFNNYNDNIASGRMSHAEGYNTTASGGRSHAEGENTTASGNFSHAEGYNTTASGSHSHAEGYSTEASEIASHAEGWNTIASGQISHSEGEYTIASGERQHVQGKYNIADVDSEGNALNTYAHIVGNGTSNDARSNAHTLDWEGNAWYNGYVEASHIILKSSDGKRYNVSIDESGTLKATEITS